MARISLLAAMAAAAANPHAQGPLPASKLHYLRTPSGEIQGAAIETNLAAAPGAWRLWASGAPGPALQTIDAHLAALDPAAPPAIFAVNGGFWDEQSQGVGVLAGERGVHAARSHPSGLAIAGGRAWIGRLEASVRWRPEGGAESQMLLNTRPVPRRTAFIVDPAAWPWTLTLRSDATAAWMTPVEPEAMGFGKSYQFELSGAVHQPVGAILAPPKEGQPAAVWPGAEAIPVPSSAELELGLVWRAGEREHAFGAADPVVLADCAGPMLLTGGAVNPELALSGAPLARRNYRTAAGCSADGRILWIVILARGGDGRRGATLRETAEILKGLGAADALNLDGGSSTSFWSVESNPHLAALFPLRMPIHHCLALHAPMTIEP